MSIDAIGAGTPRLAVQAAGASAVTADAAAASSSTAATNATGLGNFLQQFATDLQSLLTQVQATPGGGAANPATPPADLAGRVTEARQGYGVFATNPAVGTVSAIA